MYTHLRSKHSRLFPSRESRAFHIARNAKFTPDKFENYNDWFYFIHVDHYLRWTHAISMMVGFFLYFISAYKLWIFGLKLDTVLTFFFGMFFFYFLPLISHYIYDAGTAKSTPDKFHSTLIPVIHINVMTLTGSYDRWLRKFVEKYPFAHEAWALEEKENVRRF